MPLLNRAAHIDPTVSPSGYWKAQSLFFQIIHLLLQARTLDVHTGEVVRDPVSPGASELVASVCEYLQAHLAERVRVEDIARHLKTGLSTLAHRYRKETGESPLKTLARFRIDFAKSLLLQGFPPKAVASQAGFCDVYHFAKTFKRVEGVPPGAFVAAEGR
jgi:AraC-like DNA-binding protein